MSLPLLSLSQPCRGHSALYAAVLCSKSQFTPETNWHSSRIQGTNCHSNEGQFAHTIRDELLGLHCGFPSTRIQAGAFLRVLCPGHRPSKQDTTAYAIQNENGDLSTFFMVVQCICGAASTVASALVEVISSMYSWSTIVHRVISKCFTIKAIFNEILCKYICLQWWQPRICCQGNVFNSINKFIFAANNTYYVC